MISSYVLSFAMSVAVAAALGAGPVLAATPMTVQEAAARPGALAHLYGAPATPQTATRTIELRGQKTVRVKSGETVAFRSGSQVAAWHFTPRSSSANVALNDLMPVLSGGNVRLLIERSPIYSGS